MKQMSCKGILIQELGLMSDLHQNSAASTCGKPLDCDWFPPPQLQYFNLTSGDENNVTTGASSVHPLVPLLLYSDRHVPPASPFTRPITSPAAPRTGSRSKSSTCYHHNSNTRRQPVQVKKPLNAFMLYMKEMRHQVLQEGRERESAAINRILGRRWRALSWAEQSKYYDLAKKERLLHMQLYPGWSARDNYGKRKRKQNQQ